MDISSQNEQLALAPASGQGIGKIVFARLLADPNFIDEMVTAAHDGLKAMSNRRWDKDTESWICDPDYRVRIQTLFGLFAQAEGEPIKRIVHEMHKSGIDPAAELSSPASVEAAERLIAGAKARLRKAGAYSAKKAEAVVDIESASEPAAARGKF